MLGVGLLLSLSGVAHATPNEDGLQAALTSKGTSVDTGTPVYRQCVTWRSRGWPFALNWSMPCDDAHVRINVTHLRSDGWTEPRLTAKWQNVPVPVGFKPSAGSDHEAVIVNETGSGPQSVEFWALRKDVTDGKWYAQWGGGEPFTNMASSDGLKIWPTSENHYGAMASGVAYMGGIVLLSDLQAGAINHPVIFVVPRACTSYKAPATRSDGIGGTGCVQYGAKFKLPAEVDVDAIRSTSRYCAPGVDVDTDGDGVTEHYGRTADEATAAGWDPITATCPLPPTARMILKVTQTRYMVATDQSAPGQPIQFQLESYDRPRSGNWASVPAGNPYRPYMGCDGVQNTGQWDSVHHTTGYPVQPGEWEQDCAPYLTAAWKGFPYQQFYEIP